MRFLALLAMLALPGLAGCANNCPAERTLVWRDTGLIQGLADSDGFYPVGMDDQLAVNGWAMSEPWRLVFVRQFGDGWAMHLTTTLGPARLLLNLNSANSTPPTPSEVSNFVALLTGWNESEAQKWVERHPLNEGVLVPFGHSVHDPGIANPYVPKNGFWRYVDVGNVRYEWTTPHYEAATDEQHMAVAEDGSAAWWGIVAGPRPERAAREAAAAFMQDHGLEPGPPADAEYHGASPC